MSMGSAGVFVVLLLWITATVSAGPDPDHRAHGPHVHGSGEINLAVEGADLYLELSSPAANLIGFEHAPYNVQQQAQLQQLRALLSEPARLFVLPEDAACQPLAARVEMPWSGDPGQPAEHADPGHAATHADVFAEYRFVCERPTALVGLEVLLFDLFPGLQQLQVQYIAPSAQAAAVLTPRRRSLRF